MKKKKSTIQTPDRCRRLQLEWLPLTAKNWSEFEELFGPRGACGGCWCMLWRSTRSEFERNKGEGNRRAMKSIVDAGEIPGILGIVGQRPIAWCSIAPRESFPALERSRILKKVDDQPVWSISCFFVDKKQRGKGISICMAVAAIQYAKENGGSLVEAYPVEPKKGRTAPAFAWTGLASAFRKAGFTECARRSETRPVMRYRIS